MTEDHFWLLVEKYIDGELTTRENTELMSLMGDISFRDNLQLGVRLVELLSDIDERMMRDKIMSWRP